jgi:hypothetical protein
MGALFLCREEPGGAAEARIAAARAQFARHRLPAPRALVWPGWRGLHAGFVQGGPEGFYARGDGAFAAVAGTFTFDGAMGTPALAALVEAVARDGAAAPFTAWERAGGHFAALVQVGGRALLFTDYFGAFQLFRGAGDGLLSTSLLSLLHAVPRLHWSAQGVYEYAFNVFPIGDDTVFEEVRRLGPDVQLRLDTSGAAALPVAKPLPDAPADLSEAERLAAAAAALKSAAAPFIARFGDAMDCPLSGGYDSRLALALLRAGGVRPRVYVYGPPGAPDVEVARQVAAAEGFALEAVDKWAAPPDPDAFPAIVARNFEETDALATDGGFFDGGGNAAARDARQAGGRLAVSGGCGEIYRDFFFLADRPWPARAVLDAFYSAYDPADATDRFDEGAYRAALHAKIAAALGTPADGTERLARTRIEQAYPRVRCRAFFGREISLVGRFGAYFMPFFEAPVVADALRLPMAQKRAGAFEGRLIAALDPALARHPTAYGHVPGARPSARLRRDEALTRLRPLALRRLSYRLKRRLGPVDDGHGGLLGPEWLERVLDLEFPAMRAFFRPERIRDSGVYRRVAILEYLAARLGSKLAG